MASYFEKYNLSFYVKDEYMIRRLVGRNGENLRKVEKKLLK